MSLRMHGGDLHKITQQFPNAPQPWIDLSTGINPWGYPWLDKLSPEILCAAGNRLPGQNDYDSCREAYARYLGGKPENLLLGAGSQALLERLPQMFPRTDVYILGPTYQEHGHCWDRQGHKVQYLPYTPESLSFIPDGKVVVITSPNNPDGATIAPAILLDFANFYCAKGGVIVIDEAFMDLTPADSLIGRDLPDEVYILRSLGKFFGLSGMRLGALYASPDFCQRMIKLTSLWNISTLTLDIAAHALRDQAWIRATQGNLAMAMENLCAMLKNSGLSVVGQTGLFCYITGDHISDLYDQLAAGGIYTRRFRDRPDFLRLGLPPTHDAFNRLQTLLQDQTACAQIRLPNKTSTPPTPGP